MQTTITKLFCCIALLFSGIVLRAQTYTFSYAQNAGMPPGGYVTTDANTSGTAILGTSLMFANQWSAVQTLPFPFYFYGSLVTKYKVSANGVLTFDVNTTILPGANTAIPSAALPDSSIAFMWDEFTVSPPTGLGDECRINTYGTAPNRQLWIWYYNFEIGNPAYIYANWALVLEETTNKIYIVDQYNIMGNSGTTVGVQLNANTGVMDPGSPVIPRGSNGTSISDNDLWTFTYTIPCVAPPVAGTAIATPSTGICTGSAVVLGLSGNSTGSGQTYQWEDSTALSGMWIAMPGVTGASAMISASVGHYYRCEVTCNNQTVYSTPVFVNVPPLFPAGTYTINNTQPTGNGNFNSFTDAIATISCGIAGPITLNAVPGSGPYVEQLTIPPIPGSSLTNPVTINGNGVSLNYSTFTSSSARAGIKLDGADHITINGLVLNGVDSAYGWGIHLTNAADSNTISNCTIHVSTSVTSQNHNGIVISGSNTTATGGGNNGNYNVISGNTVNGGYYGISVYGTNGINNLNNTIENNTVKDFNFYGINAAYNSNCIIRGNDISRPTRTNSGAATGIYFAAGNRGGLIAKNRIHNTADAMMLSTLSFSGIEITAVGSPGQENYIVNNLLYNINSNGAIYGIQNTGASYCYIYHNTISLDVTSATPTSNTCGFYQSGTAASIRFLNNLVTISRGGSGAKYAIYKNTAANQIKSDSNVYHLNSLGSGAQHIGYQSGAQTTLAAWSAASFQDAHSVVADPIYINPATGNFAPSSAFADNKGAPVGITDDILNVSRSLLTPDVGAYEFSAVGCNGTPVAGTASVAGNIGNACVGGTIDLSLTGFSVGAGIGIQWEEALAGTGIWTQIPNATNALYSGTFTGATDYRAVVTCTNGGSYDASNIITINQNPFYLCYCSPYSGVALHSATNNYISNVEIVNTLLNSSSSTAGPGGYTQKDYTVSGNTTTLTPGQTYTLNASISGAAYGTELWIDWNQNGIFDTTEYYLLTQGNTSSVSFLVPVAAVPGLTGMRVRTMASTSVNYTKYGSCISVTNGGETEDYVITIDQAIPCSGISSVTGNITASSTSLCNGMTTSFTLTGYPLTLGIAYQWESSPSGQNNFTPIPGAAGFAYTTGPLSASTDFRVAVICTSPGGGTAYTNVVPVIVNNPAITASTGGARCGPGTVNLSANTAIGNTINWYAAATGGNPLATGNNFTTPVITSTTTYYAAASQGVSVGPKPELMYYRFDSPGGTVANEAAFPVGNNPATIAGLTVGGNGQFGFGLQGNAGPTAGNRVDPGWTGTHNGSWTISFWMDAPAATAPRYMFGNTVGNGLFRCFIGGVANGIRLLGGTPSITLDMPAWQPGASVITYVYDAAMGTLSGYINGVFQASVSPGTSYPLEGGNFVIGSQGASIDGTLDEFRMYSRALSAAEIAATWNGPVGGCEGTRVPVVATITSTPVYNLGASPDTICSGSSANVFVSSASNFTYTWTPTGSGSSFFVAPSATTTYYVTGIDANNCAIYDSVTVVVKSVPSVVTTIASPDAVCATGSTSLSLNPAPMYGIGVAWEKNIGSGYSQIAGATNGTYAEPVTATTYYRAKLYCNSNLITTSDPDTVVYNNPQVPQTFPGERCGDGSVALLAIGANSTDVRWYANAAGGKVLATGNLFATPHLTSNTTYYAAVQHGKASPVFAGPATPQSVGSGSGAAINYYRTTFDVLDSVNLVSVDIYPTAPVGSNGTVVVLDPSGNTVATIPYTTTVTGSLIPQTIPVNLLLPPGNGYQMGQGTAIDLFRNTTGAVYPYIAPAIHITGNNFDLNYYYFFYNWKIVSACESMRVPVTALINPSLGTGLSAGGTIASKQQFANTVESYTDVCNDTVAVIASGSIVLDTTAATVMTLPSVPTHGNKPFVSRVYDISPRNDGPATVTLYALQSEFNAYNSYVTSNSLSLPLLPTGPSDLTGMGNIVITQYHGSASAGTQGPLGLYSSANVDFIQNSSITVTPVGNYWKLTFPVTGFSGFFIHTGSNPLAIDLKNISAVNMGSRNRVDWTTGTEQSGDRFELERSADGTHFRKLADITAKGQPSGYSYWDETPVTGVNYYRLKMVDASGKGTYSKVVTATVKSGNFTVEAYPNPVKDVLTVKVFGVQGKDATVSITDITGKVIRIETMSSDKTTIELSGLAQGMYLIKYADSDHSQTIKVNKQ